MDGKEMQKNGKAGIRKSEVFQDEIKKNDEFLIRIQDLTEEGLGIGRQDGFVWFVKDAVPGDLVKVAATKVKRSYGFARILKIQEASPDRIIPPCPIAGRCGGCQLQSLSYPAQLRFKARKVYDDLKRIGEVEEQLLEQVFEPIVGMETPFRYRNKAQYPVARDRQGNSIAGFYAVRSHEVIPCEDCLLGVTENPALLEIVLNWMKEFGIEPYEESSGRGLIRHILLRKGFRSGEKMVCLVVNGEKVPKLEILTERLREAGVDSISLSINTERSNVIMGSRIIDLYGPGYIEDAIGSIRFRISPLSFYQVNPVQTENMYGAALEFADLKGTENVWDLYCGIGTISLFLSQKARKVYGVEIVPEAIRDARENARLNGITNTEFFTGAAEEVLPEWYEKHPEEKIHVITVDPPRKGCDEKCLETIVRMAPEKVVYVSCDPATLARDVRFLRAHGYELRRVRPVDNFPQTVHVETVVLMSRVEGK